MFLMSGGVLEKFLKIIYNMCWHFIGVSSISNLLSMYFLNYLLSKIISYTKLLLFDIYLTYNMQVIWMPYLKERLAVAPTVYTSRMNIWTTVVLLIWFKMVKLHYLDRVMRQFSGFNITQVIKSFYD